MLLVEAKAHVGETPTPDMSAAADPRSVALVASAMLRTRKHLGVSTASPAWTSHHDQVANRIAHLYWLNEVCGVPAWLVFLGFTESRGWPGWPGNPVTAARRLRVADRFSP